MTFIKPDPEMLQEEQEDLIMSYLNVDYLSTDAPLSPPSSTSSSSETTGSPEKHSVDDDFMLDINADFFGGAGVGADVGAGGGQHAWTTTTNNTNDLFNPCLPQQHHPSDLLNAFPFFLPTVDMATTSPFIQPLPVTLSSSNITQEQQPKKRRGRKKRDTTAPAPCLPQPPSLLAPKPLAPRPDVQIKQEPMVIDTSLAGPTMINETTSTGTGTGTGTTTTTISTTTTSSSTTIEPQQKQPPSIEAQKQAQIQKRQERLIKNRAAALLSRKRKREHLSLLEDEKQALLMENETLVHKVDTLQSRIQSLEKENMDLKIKLDQHPSDTAIHVGNTKRNLIHHGQKPSKATGVVFMIILFSFALFTLPSRTSDRLTVGGSSGLSKKQFPLIGSSSSSSSSSSSASSDEMDYSATEQFCQQHAECCDETSSDNLVLIDSVRPRDLQTWINHKLNVSNQSQENNDQKLIRYNANDVYLYSKEFSQLASMHASQSQTQANAPPTISLVSPYNQTATIQDSYLQIDVQVLRSQVIKGQLMSLQQYGSASTALLDGMKRDLLSSNVTRSTAAKKEHDLIVKREKRNKKISRVLI